LGEINLSKNDPHAASLTVFGIQRSGTNFLERIIRDNGTHVAVQNTWARLVWKHSYQLDIKPPFVSSQGKDIGKFGHKEVYDKLISGNYKAVYIYKNPYSWLNSITNKGVDLTVTYPEVTRPNLEKENPELMFGTLNLISLTKHWTEHTRWWYETLQKSKSSAKPFLFFKYEDIIKSAEETKKISIHIFNYYDIGFKNKPGEIKIPERVAQSERFDENKRSFYLNENFDKFSWNHIQRINEHLDKDMVKKLGYKIIESQEEYQKHKVGL